MEKAIILTHKGCVDIAALEVKEILNITAQQKQECAVFEADNEQLNELAYKSQSAIKIMQIVSEGDFDKLTIPKEIQNKKISIKGKSHTKIEELAEKFNLKIDYKNPELILYLHFEDNFFWLCIDFLDLELDKRDYRIFLGREKLTGTAAYCLLRLAGYKPEQNLLDPFCRSGIIAIEAALFATKRSPHFFSKNRFKDEEKLAKLDKITKSQKLILAIDFSFKGIAATKKNAQIAGVLDDIKITKIETEFLDTKFGKGEIDIIVTEPPEISTASPEKKILTIYKHFFDNAAFLLPEKGIVACISNKPTDILEKSAKEHKFNIKHKRTIYQGKEAWQIIVFLITH